MRLSIRYAAFFAFSPTNTYNNYKFGTQTCSLNFRYNSYTVKPSIFSKNGKFSRYDPELNILIIGDGEDVTFGLQINEENASATIGTATYTKSSPTSPDIGLYESSAGKWNIKHPTDIQTYEYYINNSYTPVLSGQKTLNWKTDIVWHCTSAAWGDYAGLVSGTFSTMYFWNGERMNENSSQKWIAWHDDEGGNYRGAWWSKEVNLEEKGKVYSEAAFKAIPWYYCPGIVYGSYQQAVWGAGVMTENVDATRRPVSDETIVSFSLSGIIKVTIHTPDGTKSQNIEVYTEVRNCLMK